MFERLYKVDEARAADSTGSGLGLSITEAIIERHGGTIDVTSQPGQTTFSRAGRSRLARDQETW